MTTETVYVAVYDDWADWEAGHATAHLRSGAYQATPDRFRVVTVGATLDEVTTAGGLRVRPECAVDDIDVAGAALLILAGASTWHAPGGNAAFAAAARRFLDAGKPVAAICGATFGLAREGLLDDREHTSGAAEYLAAAGYAGAAHYREAPAVTDRNLITAGPTAPVEFAREIFARLDAYAPEALDAWYRLFSESDPTAYPVLMAASPAPA